MKNNIDMEKSTAIVSKIVERLNDSIKVGNKMDSYDIVEVSVTLINEYWFLKIEQLLHFCRMCRQGRFGSFQRFDQPTFFESLGKYLLNVDELRAKEYQATKEHPGDRYENRIKTPLTIKDLTDHIKANPE